MTGRVVRALSSSDRVVSEKRSRASSTPSGFSAIAFKTLPRFIIYCIDAAGTARYVSFQIIFLLEYLFPNDEHDRGMLWKEISVATRLR